MKEIDIYTDGACSGNPGPGGWAAILRYNGIEKEISEGEKSTTNNRMELTGVIEALKILKEPCSVTLWTDSKYVADGLGKGWAENWKKRGWKKSDNKPALNTDLWDELLKLNNIHSIKIRWIKGHASHPENERCDKMAVEQSQKYSKDS